MKYAILIDGGFVKHKLGSRVVPLTPTTVLDFIEALSNCPALATGTLHRIYWYDAPPLERRVNKPLRGGRIDFGATDFGRANAVLQDELSKAPHFSMRSGYCAFRGWRIKRSVLTNDQSVSIIESDLEPNIQQKGVDMRLGLDIAALTLKSHVDTVVLVAGDSDFVPAMKFARREGAQIYLVSLGHHVMPDMLVHSDIRIDVPGFPATNLREPIVEDRNP